MKKSRSAAAIAALLFALGACGGGSVSTDTASDAGTSTAEEAADSAPTESVLEGSFPTVAGGQLDLGTLAGQDTVLWFWAPW